MKRIIDRAGYYFNDDRASGGKFEEDDLFGCGHCERSMKRSKWKNHGGMCLRCNRTLCYKCYSEVHKLGCTGPEEEKIIKAVSDLHRKQQNAKVLGI